MRLIYAPLLDAHLEGVPVLLKVDRLQLAKRRWRGVAADREEFGFDLERPLIDGALFFTDGPVYYRIEQLPEPVIDIPCPEGPLHAARLGWLLGNLHFPIQLLPDRLRIADDTAIRQLLKRESIAYTALESVFHPFAGAQSHGA